MRGDHTRVKGQSKVTTPKGTFSWGDIDPCQVWNWRPKKKVERIYKWKSWHQGQNVNQRHIYLIWHLSLPSSKLMGYRPEKEVGHTYRCMGGCRSKVKGKSKVKRRIYVTWHLSLPNIKLTGCIAKELPAGKEVGCLDVWTDRQTDRWTAPTEYNMSPSPLRHKKSLHVSSFHKQ